MFKVKNTLFILIVSYSLLTASDFEKNFNSDANQPTIRTSENLVPEFGSIRKINEDFYTGIGRAGSGEIVYFGMECITPKNKAGFDAFASVVKFFGEGPRGPIGGDFLMCDPMSRDDYVLHCQKYGFSYEEYLQWVTSFQKDFKDYSQPKKISKRMQLGTNVMIDTPLEIGDYFVYATKTPVNDTLSFEYKIREKAFFYQEGIDGIKAQVSVKNFFSLTENLIMTVGTHVNWDKQSYYNRGIQRTKRSILHEDGFKNIAIPLHAFSAIVVKDIFPTVMDFGVAPLGSLSVGDQHFQSMESILQKTFDRKEYKLMSDEEYKGFPKGSHGLGAEYEIQIAVLIEFYNNQR